MPTAWECTEIAPSTTECVVTATTTAQVTSYDLALGIALLLFLGSLLLMGLIFNKNGKS